MHFDSSCLFRSSVEVGNQSDGQTKHESAVQRNFGEAQQTDNHQGQDAVEPDHLRTLHESSIVSRQVVVLGAFVFVFRQHSSFASGVQASAAALFANTHVGSEDHQDNQTNALQGDQFLPQCVNVCVQHNAGTGNRAAPRQQVHDGHGSTDDANQHYWSHMQFFINRKHSRNRDQQGGSQSAVQVGDNSDAGGSNGNHNDVAAGFFNQPVYHRVEQAHIAHHGEVNDGENEQYSGGPGFAYASRHKFEDLSRGKTGDQGCNNRNNNEQRYGVRFPANQGCHNDDNHQKTNNAQEHSSVLL